MCCSTLFYIVFEYTTVVKLFSFFLGDDCDPDMDGDGKSNDVDNCQLIINPLQEDKDEDGVGDSCDNCLDRPNPKQVIEYISLKKFPYFLYFSGEEIWQKLIDFMGLSLFVHIAYFMMRTLFFISFLFYMTAFDTCYRILNTNIRLILWKSFLNLGPKVVLKCPKRISTDFIKISCKRQRRQRGLGEVFGHFVTC